MPASSSVEALARVVVPDDLAALESHRFPSPELVASAASLFRRLPSWDGSEGPRSRLVIAPGVVQVSRRDAARFERSLERALDRRRATVEQLRVDATVADELAAAQDELAAVQLALGVDSVAYRLALRRVTELQELELLIDHREDGVSPRGAVTSWSRKSRANMVKVLAQLDYRPLLDAAPARAMLTLTYPGEWLAVAPDALTCKRHVDELKRRFRKAWGVPLIGVWKREFQSRGAPHYHILMAPPAGRVNGQTFREWVSVTWAAVVKAEWCGRACWVKGPSPANPEGPSPARDVGPCCERGRHVLAGTGLDFNEGLRARDPKRLGVYFCKHGMFAAKDYQNEAPAEWEGQSVGRFWGVWGLDKALATVEVHPEHALAAARTLRRYSRAQRATVSARVWRQRVDTSTGEVVGGRWRNTRTRVRRVRGSLGYLVVNDGPAFASQLARYLDQLPDELPSIRD